MSKKELIEYIKQLINQRAFSYEDRMTLAIIDACPNITIWASDRHCNIKFWTNHCHHYYGRSATDVMDKNFVYLFVQHDEQRAAHRDCVKIIDDGVTFHNIAKDLNKYGRFDRLITNCFRILDVETGEPLQAEIAVPLPDMDEEESYFADHVKESREIDGLIKNLENTVKAKRAELSTLLRNNKRSQFSQETQAKISAYQEQLNLFRHEQYRQETHKVFDKDQCEQQIEYDTQTFISQYEDILASVEMEKKTNNKSNKRFKVALSFPGEHRVDIIEPIAIQLSEIFSKESVLYDLFHRAEFARPNLDIHLQNLYHDESELIVVCLCDDYSKKEWCGLEWRAIRDLMNKRHNNNIMFLRADGGKVDGIFGTIDGHIDVSKANVLDVAQQIIKRYYQSQEA